MGSTPGLMPDVIVVGGGPVGQTAALLCARWGLHVTILEAQAQRDRVGSRAICQQREVLDTWDSIGAGTLAERGVTWSRGKTYYRDQEIFSVELKDRGSSLLPPFVNISQSEVESVLLDLIGANPHIELRYGARVQRIRSDANGATVELQTEHGAKILRGKFAIVCGGSHADELRAQLGVDFPGQSFQDLFLICDIKADLPEFKGERRFHFDPTWNRGRQVLIHEQPDNIWRIDWQVPAHFDLAVEEKRGGLDQRIRQIVGDQPYELVWCSVYRFQGRVATRFRVGSTFLAGDCAHVFAPFGARGLNSGVHDVENLAWKLAMAKRGIAGESLLESYETERRAAALENLEVTGATMRFLVPQTAKDRRRRTELLEQAAYGSKVAIDQVDSGRLYEPFWYIDSPLTTPHPSRTFRGRPARGEPVDPVPGTALPDLPTNGPTPKRLRQRVHGGFTVISDAPESIKMPEGVDLRTVAFADADPTGTLRQALDLDVRIPTHVVVRPDGHIAAFVEGDGDAVSRSVARCLGYTLP